MASTCERCGGSNPPHHTGPFVGMPEMVDYCAECGKNLCDDCMAKGCCDHVPALSGQAADYGEEDESP